MKLIYSAGGYSRELLRCARDAYPEDRFLMVDDNPSGASVGYEEARKTARADDSEFCIAFSDHVLRKAKAEAVARDGFGFYAVQAATSIVGDGVSMGRGCVLSDFTLLTADCSIGDFFQCNVYSYVAHDCVVGDFVTLAPRVSINGRVHIGDGAYFGTGATVLPGTPDEPLRIGAGAVIGAHSLVTRDVPPGVTVVGVPAKPLAPRRR